MSGHDDNHRSLTSPLLQPPSDDHLVITVRTHGHHPPTPAHSEVNPYKFIGSSGPLAVPDPPTVDPFRNATPRIGGLYEVVKVVLCLPIAAARLVLFGVSLAVGYLATLAALHGWKDRNNPMPRWRSRLMWITRLCARSILFAFGYQWIRRKGKPAPRAVAPIVVSNHVSYVEPIFFFYELFPTMVASESHDSIPVVGTIIRAMQVIYVDRFLPMSRKHAVNEIKRKAACDRFPPLLLFPEGTTTNGRVLISFQLGAFIPRYPIQPVVVRYPHVHFDQSWGNISLGMLMFRMFTQFHNFMEVEYLPVVSPVNNGEENPSQFAARTSRAIATSLNVVQTSHSYGDVMLLSKASESKHVNPSSFMVEMARIESIFHLSSLEALDFLDKFLLMNPDSSGRVKFNDFLIVLRLKASTLSEEVFRFIDVEKVGTITFKQFLSASVHVLRQPLFRQACDTAFSKCNKRGVDEITERELADIIRLAVPDVQDAEIHNLFGLFDSNGEMKVSKDSFVSCLRRNPLLIALFSPCLIHMASSEAADNLMYEEIA